jgi:YidC/Oxa1 family membrane protein insertase
VVTPSYATNVDEQTLTITNENARYIFTTHGGGLKRVELVHYLQTVSRERKKLPMTNGVATLNDNAPTVLAALTEGAQGDGIFVLSPITGGMRAEKTLSNGLHVVKDFHISTNYLVFATVRLENRSDAALNLPAQEWAMGTAVPMGPDDTGMDVGMMWYNGSSKDDIKGMWFDNRTLGCIPGVPRPEYRAGTSNVIWASSHNQYFTLVAMPKLPGPQVVCRPLILPRPPLDEIPANLRNAPPPKGFVTSFAYPAETIAPGGAVEREYAFFAGPKEYKTLASVANRFKNEVDAVMGFDLIFPFYKLGGFFGKFLLAGMNGLHAMFNLSYGWVIILITVIIKLLFWPLTAASTRSMKRMATLQPQMKALQEKYKEDPVKMNKKMMEFWKENKVNPMGGCLPMLLQMPVFFGFFTMIRAAVELRGVSWLWVADLSKPDTLFMIPGILFPFNVLPLIMGATMLWQSHLTPPSPGMDPMQQKMMRYMPLMFLVFLYNYSSGLALYWTVNNLLSILQTKVTRSNQPATTGAPGAPALATSPALTPASKKKK